ncbi:MAG: YihA family ribosome biogenesis GTP-binding protein [candidate division Zixibacteria bacterium]|nr:YihA family ribosome biogenesis GTP-binding protein [candidate division Zixibacteria bacterium]
MKKNKPIAEFKLSAYALDQLPRDGFPHIAFAGRSNVGKSSLLNSLLDQKGLAKTSSTPGRTQAINVFEIDSSYYFIDLPGYGFAKAPISVKEKWAKLVDGYFRNCRELAGVIVLLDCRRIPSDDDLTLLDWLISRSAPFIIALTKSDKLGRGKLSQTMRSLEKVLPGGIIPYSSPKGTGKKELWSWIRTILGEY